MKHLNSNQLGILGETLFEKYYRSKEGYIVENTTANPEYFSKDIDFFVTDASGNRRSFEVKYDSRVADTGNLYLEIQNIHSSHAQYRGWWLFCEADYLFYGDAQNTKFYVFNVKELREKLKTMEPRTTYCRDYCGQPESEGQLVKLSDIKDIIITTIDVGGFINENNR